jgi:hypothetical protein
MSKELADQWAAPGEAPMSEGTGLDLADFALLDAPPVDGVTRTVQMSVWFRGALYLGIGSSPYGLTRLAGQGAFDAGPGESSYPPQQGAEIWRYSPGERNWVCLYRSPLNEEDTGRAAPRDVGILAAAVCQSAVDAAPALYVATSTLDRPCVFLRCEDGTNFIQCDSQGFGLEDAGAPAVSSIVALDGKVFAAPVGVARGMLDVGPVEMACVFETDDPLHGSWRAISEPGFGDDTNVAVSSLAAYAGHLYAATCNERHGFQLWKCRPTGEPPYRWTKLLDNGAWRPLNAVPTAMTVFDEALYIAAAVQRTGHGGRDRFGPFPPDMVRVHADDRWELVTGQPRFTPHGFKRPTSQRLAGLDDYFTHAFWCLAEQNGWLYCGTSSWSWMPTYLNDRSDLTDERYAWLEEQSEAQHDGEFRLWRTRDGDDWQQVTDIGFPGGNALNFGVRTMTASAAGLFVLPIGEVDGEGHRAIEIWLGQREEAEEAEDVL